MIIDYEGAKNDNGRVGLCLISNYKECAKVCRVKILHNCILLLWLLLTWTWHCNAIVYKRTSEAIWIDDDDGNVSLLVCNAQVMN